MRRALAGLLLLLIIPTCGLAQPKGEVESIGFGSFYRPNCFVPMLIRLQADKSGTYQIQVVQEDMDRDREIFRQEVSLTGAEDGKGVAQKFWMYFIPQPTDGGLPDTTRGGNLRELQQKLKVFLCDEKGKEVAQLPITQTIINADDYQFGFYAAGSPRGVKLVLAVTDGSSQPIWRDYQQTIGTMEDTGFITVQSADLPEDVRGYEMIDAIVWLAAPLPDPAKPSEEKRFHAIQAFVRGGGHLVICQPAQRDATASVADMLPVDVDGVAPRPDLGPLKRIAVDKLQELEKDESSDSQDERKTPRPKFNQLPEDTATTRNPSEDWTLPIGPFMFAHATAKPGAVVDEMKIRWQDGSETPYIARWGYGLGCVTWVAHDLSDPSIIARAKSGWPFIWDRILDTNNNLIIVNNHTSDKTRESYGQATPVDLSRSLLDAMELQKKSAALVSIAVVFFIGYWIVAGPGVYLFLMSRKRQQFSWFFFGLSAVAATLLTVLVVKLVVRGSPEIAHITIVRGAVGEPAISLSRFGLYIPRDGAQEITLTDLAPRNISYITAYPKHPKHAVGDIEFPAQEDYFIPIHDTSEEGPVSVSVPYRSTEKLFQVRRVGAISGSIECAGKLRGTEGGDVLEGILTNATGARLRNVYLVYHETNEVGENDIIYYVPKLDASQSLNLHDLRMRTDDKSPEKTKFIGDSTSDTEGQPGGTNRLYGVMGTATSSLGWSRYWYTGKGMHPGSQIAEGSLDDLSQSLVMMSLFSRLPPMRHANNSDPARQDLLRRGGRYMDISNAVAAGKMVVLAEADDDGKSPLPFPLEVEGQKIAGAGTVFYQFVLPLERIPAEAYHATDPTQTRFDMPTSDRSRATPQAIKATMQFT